MDSFYEDYEYNYTYYNYTLDDVFPLKPHLPNKLFPQDWIDIFMNIIVFVLGVPGNGLVVWVTNFEMKKTVNSVWFLNLAVADLMCCFSVPFAIMSIALGYWPLGHIACKLIPSMVLVNLYASVLLLTMISIDRCALVVKPVWCQNNRNVNKAYVACLIIWILAFLLSSPSFVFRTTSTDPHYGIQMCVYNYIILRDHKETVEHLLAVIKLLLGFILPFVVIIACYTVLLKRVQRRFSQSMRTLKMILIIIVGFFVCGFPYHVVAFILAVHPSRSPLFTSAFKVQRLVNAIACINSCINPVIYVLMGGHFKKKMKKSIKIVIKNALVEALNETPDNSKTKTISETQNTSSTV